MPCVAHVSWACGASLHHDATIRYWLWTRVLSVVSGYSKREARAYSIMLTPCRPYV